MVVIQRGAASRVQRRTDAGPDRPATVPSPSSSRAEPALSGALGQLRADLERARSGDRIRRNRMWLERLPTQRESMPALIRELND